MSFNLDIVIETPEHSVDMKAGLDSLQGASDATRCIAETLLTKSVPERLSHKSKVRTALKQSFKGSYGHIFSLDIYDEALQKKFNKIGNLTFAELTSYFFSESLYQDSKELSPKAQKIVDELGDTAEELVKQLRKSALENIHEVSTKFNYDLKIRYRQSRDEQTVLVKFNQSTAKVLQVIPIDETLRLIVSITRLNINTGNGRLLVKGENETIPFGFGIEYRDVNLRAKKIFSENLDFNNGIHSDEWRYLDVSVQPIKLKDGKVIKYIVKAFYGSQ